MDPAKLNFCQASLAEFLAVCSLGGTATLTYTTTNGNTKATFDVGLGYLGPPRPPRHRGPAARERGRQRAACHQAAQAAPSTTSPPAATTPGALVAPLHTAQEESTAPVDPAPVTFASIVAKPAAPADKSHKCCQCSYSSKTEAGLKIHVGKTHKRLESAPAPATPPPAPSTPAPPPATPAPVVRPRKSMYYHPKDTCPPHTPPPPKCKRCGEATTWLASRIKTNKAWLHEFACHTCTDRTCLSTRTTLTTPAIT